MNEHELLKELDEKMRILVLVSGALEDGSSHWAYASVPMTKYEAFKAAEKQGDYDLAAFGHILEHGTGNEPPADIIQKMKDKYGANHKFEEELDAMMQQIETNLKN